MEERYLHTFASDQSFLDPPTFNNKPYGPQRFKDLVRECWLISDRTHTSYTDVLDISVAERIQLLDCIRMKQDLTARAIEEAKASHGLQ